MESVDAVKLVYQSAFGCGHLLSENCARRLAEELARTPARGDVPVGTPIGNRLCRLNLAAPAVQKLPPGRIADMMRVTMAQPLGGEAAMNAGLEALRELARAGEAPFSPESLEAFLGGWDGHTPVSHSEAYRAAYAPAYRVVREDLGTLVPAVVRIERKLAEGGRALAVLDGPCGSGKSTLADALAALYHTQPIRMDDFFLPPAMRTEQRLTQPGGNVHYERFREEVLAGLMRGGDAAYRRYDCQSGAWLDRVHRAAPVTVIEGSYSHHPAFAEAYGALDALRIFVHTAEEERMERLRAREGERFFTFETRWIPLEKSYLEAYDIKSGADIALESQPWA